MRTRAVKIDDVSGRDLVRFLNRLLRKHNPDTTLAERKKWIIEEMTLAKYMTVKQARQFCKEMKR